MNLNAFLCRFPTVFGKQVRILDQVSKIRPFHSIPFESEGFENRPQICFLPCPFFYSALRTSFALRATYRAPARIWLAVIDFQNGESRSGSDKKRRNRLQQIRKDPIGVRQLLSFSFLNFDTVLQNSIQKHLPTLDELSKSERK